MFGIHFGTTVPSNYRDWKKTGFPLYEAWAWKLIEHGVMLEPDSREPWFLCEAHQDMDMQWLEGICRRAMREVQSQ